MLRIISIFNVPRHLCRHALGEEHTTAHRMTAGAGIMVVGVVIAKSAAEIHFPGAHLLLDLVGYAVHGIGATPYIEWLLKAE